MAICSCNFNPQRKVLAQEFCTAATGVLPLSFGRARTSYILYRLICAVWRNPNSGSHRRVIATRYIIEPLLAILWGPPRPVVGSIGLRRLLRHSP